MKIDQIESPTFLKDLTIAEMQELAGQLRSELIATVAKNGGHLASNLGVVELTLALHRVFNLPQDKLIFDVGHQSYVHKLLTGRAELFHTLRSYGGISGFPKRCESEYDTFETGHASTAISAALGMARARDQLGQAHDVIALVGDGALTGGMCYEALNDAGSSKTRMIVILNDNEMSIARNVGALSRHLTNLRTSKGWKDAKAVVRSGLYSIPLIGKPAAKGIEWIKNAVKALLVNEDSEGFFDALGFRYFGPIDGHDLAGLIHTLEKVRELKEPVVVHVLTQKGHGYDKAEQKPEIFHGTPPFYVESGDRRKVGTLPSYGTVMAKTLAELAQDDPRIITITAAMPSGTGLNHFQEVFPDRMIDVGIAEEHAVTMAAGLAAGGMKPYFAVYTSFFQRSFDQMLHDVCMQNLNVTFLLDRAGLVGEDGETHHGVWDLATLLPAPNMTVLAPRDIEMLRAMLRWTQTHDGPCAIRYGKVSTDLSSRYPVQTSYLPGKWEILEQGEDCVLLAVGSMVETAIAVHALLKAQGIHAQLVDCASIKPMDLTLLRAAADKPVFTLEEHVHTGGFGAAVCAFYMQEAMKASVRCFALPDAFIPHGSRTQLLAHYGLTPESIAEDIVNCLKGK